MDFEQIDAERGIVLTHEESKAKRKKDGYCPTCPSKLYEIKKSKFSKSKVFSKKVPLTISGKVLEGRCLLCRPIVTEQSHHRRGGISEKSAKKLLSSFDWSKSEHGEKNGNQFARETYTHKHALSSPTVRQSKMVVNSLRGSLESPQYDEKKEDQDPETTHSSKHESSILHSHQGESERSLGSISLESIAEAESPMPRNLNREEDSYNDSKSSIFQSSFVSDVTCVIPDIIEEMFSSSASIQEQKERCEQIMALAHGDTAKHEIISSGGLTILKEMMDGEYILDADLQEKACEAFNLLISVATENDLEDLYIVKNVTNVMNQHLESLKVQENGVGILWNLSTRNNYKSMIVKNDGINTVLLVMNLHSSSTNVQKNGCALLCNMSAEPQIRAYLCQSGCCHIMVDAMKAYQNEEQVQLYGCATFLNLSSDIENREIVETSGAMQALIDAISFHAESQGIQKCGNEALSYLLGM